MTKAHREPLIPIGKYTDAHGVLRWCDDDTAVVMGNAFTSEGTLDWTLEHRSAKSRNIAAALIDERRLTDPNVGVVNLSRRRGSLDYPPPKPLVR